MLEQLIKCLHLIGGTVFLGITIASYFYISYSKSDQKLRLFALKTSLLGDILIALIIVLQYITATLLVKLNHLSFATPWIIVAYIAFSLVSFCWLVNVIIKVHNVRLTNGFQYNKLFHAMHMLIILVFILIIHDAVMQKTYFNFLFPGH